MYTEKEKKEKEKYLEILENQLKNDIDFLKNEIKFLKRYIKLDEEKINKRIKECIKDLENVL